MSKNEIASKLKALGLNYNFVYKYSNNVKEGKTISQSISSGSEVSKGTTITITLSKGKNTQTTYREEPSYSNSNSSKPNNGSTTKPTTPTCDTSVKTTVYIYDELFSSSPSVTCSNIKKAYSKVKFNCTYKSGTGLANGLLVNSSSIDAHSFDHCNTITLVISSN